ncbi:copper homeostasis protein CutC [Yoonia sp. R2331]|uniref:copper homeostasis protein CutC n=1 Tax=Yoonia sp. R2331 TaxID=3237238 RepID=UPI0034E5B9EA
MPRNNPYTLEICASSPDAVAACAGIADRIELCSALDLGGLTPDIGMMELAASLGIETHVLIRSRSGDFAMTASDQATAVTSIRAARAIGLKGVVIGAESNGALDRRSLETLVAAADGLDITLHRVIDVVDDPFAALEVAIDLGIRRVLSSGAASSAIEGIAGLDRLHAAAAGRIEIMAGAGINSANLPVIMAKTRLTAFHTSCTRVEAAKPHYAKLGFGTTQRSIDLTELDRLARLCHKLS